MFVFLYNKDIPRHNKFIKYLNKYLSNKPKFKSNNNLKEIIIITRTGYQLFGLTAILYIIKKILFNR